MGDKNKQQNFGKGKADKGELVLLTYSSELDRKAAEEGNQAATTLLL